MTASVDTRYPFDPQSLVALHESFKLRFAQLWSAAVSALSTPGATMPQIVADAPGDRRFNSAAWREQPFFAWVKQAYLLYGEYLMAMTSLANLSTTERRRLEFSIQQFIEAIAPTNFPATNPDVLKRALETDGASVVAGLRNFAADV